MPVNDFPILFDWNCDNHQLVPMVSALPRPTAAQLEAIDVDDEGLRDGLQGVQTLPTLDAAFGYIQLAHDVGIRKMTVGVYSQEGSQADATTKSILSYMASNFPDMTPIVLARALPEDLQYAHRCQELNPALETLLFQASSPVRLWVSGWTIEGVLSNMDEHMRRAIEEYGLNVLAATEDTSRSTPEFIQEFITCAVARGASRMVLADTTGHLDPWGCYRFVSFVRATLDQQGDVGRNIGIDFHGHRDRNLDVPVALAAISAGATRIHGVPLGIGERSGNGSLESILYNIVRLGREAGANMERWDLGSLFLWATSYAQMTSVAIPSHYPIVGGNSFTTAAGIHADAQEKALLKYREVASGSERPSQKELDHIGHTLRTIYTTIDHGELERPLEYLIGPFAGESTVRMWLYEHGYDVTPGMKSPLAQRIKTYAKTQSRLLTQEEIEAIIHQVITS